MKLLHIIALAAFLAFSGTAQAATIVDYTGNDVDMGYLSLGQSGTITNNQKFSSFLNSVSGYIPSNSMITFTYTLSGNALNTVLTNFASYFYETAAGDLYAGGAYANAPGSSGAIGTVNGGVSSPLVLIFANLVDSTHGSVVIKNYSADVANFVAMIAGFMASSGVVSAYYEVSSIPLPAALSMFGLGIAAVAGLGLRKKRSAI